MYPAHGFAIERIAPTSHADIWLAEVAFTSDVEVIDGHNVAHNARVIVRFSYPEDGSTAGLLDAAHEKVRTVLGFFVDAVQRSSISQLREIAREKAAEHSRQWG